MNMQIPLGKLLSAAFLGLAIITVPTIGQAHDRGHRDHQNHGNSVHDFKKNNRRDRDSHSNSRHHKKKYNRHHRQQARHDHYDRHDKHRYGSHKYYYSNHKVLKPRYIDPLYGNGLFLYWYD